MSDWVVCATRWGSGVNRKIDLSGEFIKKPHPLPLCCTKKGVPGTPIQDFYSGANVLITGATGFMGKILLEKLLASCPNISKIFLIIREKRGRNANERLEDLFNDSAFCRLKQTVPDFKEKVIAIHGDCSILNLGLTASEYQTLVEHIDIVFHGAATVKFTEKLRDATLINVSAVNEILKFCRQCKNLKSVVHVSTAYTNTLEERDTVLEKFYPPQKSYKDILQLAERNSEELNRLESEIISPWPNTYSFTKKLAEDLIAAEGVGLPISIFRPGVVIASYEEPVPGWSDNIYGPTAVIVGSYLGAIRVIPVNRKSRANLVPVDLAVNGLIAAAWKNNKQIRNSSEDIPIYNYVSEARNPMTWGEFSKWNEIYGWNWPSAFAVWYPILIFAQHPVLFSLYFFFLHTVPAYIIDTVLWLSRRKPLMKATNQKITKFYELLSYFGTNNWSFRDDNVLRLWQQLSLEDQAIFPFDIAQMNWDQHAQTQVLGLRLHVVKDPIETLDKARCKFKRLAIQHRLLQLFLLVILSWILLKILD